MGLLIKAASCIWRNNGGSVEGGFYCDAIDKMFWFVRVREVGGRSSEQ